MTEPKGKGPTSFHDIVAQLSDHTEEDRQNFDGMKRAFTGVEKQLSALDVKQDEQSDVLKALLQQADASALERGRRIEREERERKAKERNERWYKWARWVIVPVTVTLTHLITKYLMR